MATEDHTTARDIPGKASPALRLALLAALFVAEFLAISFRVDAYALIRVDAAWAQALAHAGQLSRVGLGVVAAFVVAAWPRLPQLWSALRAAAQVHDWRAIAGAQFMAFLAFYGATVALFEHHEALAHWAGWAAPAWAMLAATVLVLALLCLAPAAFWRDLARRERVALAASVAVGVAAWLAARMGQALWEPLAGLTFHMSAWLLGLAYPASAIVADTAKRTLGTGGFEVTIDSACSGYEGIGLITLFLALYLSLYRHELRFPHALLLFPLGIGTIWLFNALRIAALIVIGAEWSPDVAVGGFHSQAGWIAFLAVALALLAVLHHSPLFARAGTTASVGPARPASRVAPAMVLPLVALLAATLLTGALSAGFDWLYPLRVLAVGLALLWGRRQLAVAGWRPRADVALAGVVAFGLWVWLVPIDAEADRAFGAALDGVPPAFAALWLAVRSVGAIVTVPLAEELAFRGYLLSRLCGREPAMTDRLPVHWLAVAVSSVTFGLLHGAWLAGTLAGLAYAWVRYRRGQVLDAVLAHAVTNGLVTAYVLATGNWGYW